MGAHRVNLKACDLVACQSSHASHDLTGSSRADWSIALLIHVMKRLLTKASKPFGFSLTSRSNSPSPASPLTLPPIHLSNPTVPHTTDLQPKFAVPAVPQPYPHTYLAILVTKEGLLIRPHVFESGIDQTEWLPCIRVSWGKSVKVEEIERNQLSENLDWNEGVIVYGIVGILELFSCSFLMLFLAIEPVLKRLSFTRFISAAYHIQD